MGTLAAEAPTIALSDDKYRKVNLEVDGFLLLNDFIVQGNVKHWNSLKSAILRTVD